VEIVEHQHDGLLRGESLEQLADRAVREVALVVLRHGELARGAERRQYLGELGAHVVVERRDETWIEPADVLVERIHEDSERQVALELRGAPREDDVAACIGQLGELRKQAGLADPGLADQLEQGGAALIELAECALEPADFAGTTNQTLENLSQPPSPPARGYPGSSGGRQCEDQGAGSGCRPDAAGAGRGQSCLMPCFLLHHSHRPDECGVAFASFKGHDSPLRRHPAFASCRTGGHAIWWTVDAASAADALALLPFFVATRTSVTTVSKVDIP
jgi:hypothetical protein